MMKGFTKHCTTLSELWFNVYLYFYLSMWYSTACTGSPQDALHLHLYTLLYHYNPIHTFGENVYTRAHVSVTPPGWQVLQRCSELLRCAYGCINRFGEPQGLGFYRFLAVSEARKKEWIRAVKRQDWVPWKYSRICGNHFVSGKLTRSYSWC